MLVGQCAQLVPVVLGLTCAVPLGWLAHRSGAFRSVLLGGAGLLYTIPSLALFVLLPAILGTRILDPINVVAALNLADAPWAKERLAGE